MIISSFWREKKIKIIFSTGLFFLVRPFVVDVIKMYWYTIGDIFVNIGDIFVNIGLLIKWNFVKICVLFEWINYFVWSTYDPATDSHISPCAVIDDPECSQEYIRSGYYQRMSCLLTPDYCEITLLCTLAVFCFFCIFGPVFMYVHYWRPSEKCGLLKETKIDHVE